MNYDRKHYDKPIGIEVLVQDIPCIIKKKRTFKLDGITRYICTGCILNYATADVCCKYACNPFERLDGQSVRFVLKTKEIQK